MEAEPGTEAAGASAEAAGVGASVGVDSDDAPVARKASVETTAAQPIARQAPMTNRRFELGSVG